MVYGSVYQSRSDKKKLLHQYYLIRKGFIVLLKLIFDKWTIAQHIIDKWTTKQPTD